MSLRHTTCLWRLTRRTVRTVLVMAFLLVASPLVASQELGVWDPPFPLQFQVVHMAHLPTGKILMWGELGSESVYQSGFHFKSRVYNPATGTLTIITPPVNLMCSGHAGLPDGRVLVIGGGSPYDHESSIFDPITETWSEAAYMNFGRWYGTLTTLPDGRLIAVLGTLKGGRATIPEVYDPWLNTWTTLPGANKDLSLYPRNFVGTDGRLISAGKQQRPSILDVHTQTWTDLATTTMGGGPAVMYEPGKILKSGSDSGTGTSRAVVANFNDALPKFRDVARMAFARTRHNMTLLPDGTVLTTGGQALDGVPIYAAEVWDPTTERYTTLASMTHARLYHSAAILLGDGRVLSGGGEPDDTTAEIFSPPYLFKGPRPSITFAPAAAAYGGSFDIQTPDVGLVNKVSLVRLGAVTHSFDQNQRFMWLNFTAGTGGITVQAPANGSLAPPGVYMLFLISNEGVPSVASYIRMGSP